jgi:hypothetical protein
MARLHAFGEKFSGKVAVAARDIGERQEGRRRHVIEGDEFGNELKALAKNPARKQFGRDVRHHQHDGNFGGNHRAVDDAIENAPERLHRLSSLPSCAGSNANDPTRPPLVDRCGSGSRQRDHNTPCPLVECPERQRRQG